MAEPIKEKSIVISSNKTWRGKRELAMAKSNLLQLSIGAMTSSKIRCNRISPVDKRNKDLVLSSYAMSSSNATIAKNRGKAPFTKKAVNNKNVISSSL